MHSFLNILLVSLTILYLNNELQAADVPLAAMQQEQPQPQQQQQQQHNSTKVQIIKDIKEFIQQNPHLRLIRLQKKAPNNYRSQSVKYTLGNRITGDDGMVAQYADTFYYNPPADVSKQVTFPGTGSDSIVTFVDIHCLQDNADGNAYVVAGGIGQRFISIVLETPQTHRFTYNVHIYGTNSK